MEIFKLFGTILVDASKANENIDNTDKKSQSLMKTLGNGIATAAKWGAALAAGATAALAGMKKMADGAASATDRIDKSSQKIGLSREAFQEWDFILSQSGTSVDKLQVGLKTLNTRMEEAAKGSGTGADLFKELGLSAQDSAGNMKTQEQVFEELVLRLQEMPDGAEKARMATQLLGKAGQELMPLLNGAAGSVEDMRSKAHELGLVLSDEAVDAGVAYTDMMDQINRAVGSITTQIGVSVMPILTTLGQMILDHLPEIQAVISAFFSVLSVFVNTAVDAIGFLIRTFLSLVDSISGDSENIQSILSTLSEKVKEIMSAIQELISEVLKKLSEFWKKHGDEISKTVKTAFELIKTIISTALDIIKNLIKTATAVLKGDWGSAWEGIKGIVSSALNGIAQLIPGLLELIYQALRNAISVLYGIGSDMFSSLWSGLQSVWESVSGWVSEKVSWLTDKLAFWRKGQDEMREDHPDVDGSHAGGLAYVPFDGYVARLHKGERVLTAAENRSYDQRQQSSVQMFFDVNATVREDADIQRVAQKLYDLIRSDSRGKGVVTV